MKIIKFMTLRAFFLFVVAILVIVLVLVYLYYLGKYNKLKKANTIMYYPAKSYQDKNITTLIDPYKKFAYIEHDMIDKDNMNLDLYILADFSLIANLLKINDKYNIILIHNSIMEDNNSYTISELITYINFNRLPICKICIVKNNELFYSNLDTQYDNYNEFFYYVEKENKV